MILEPEADLEGVREIDVRYVVGGGEHRDSGRVAVREDGLEVGGGTSVSGQGEHMFAQRGCGPSRRRPGWEIR